MYVTIQPTVTPANHLEPIYRFDNFPQSKLVDPVASVQTLETFWDDLFPAEKNRLIHLLIETVTVREDGLDIVLKTNGLNSLVMEFLTYAVEVEGRATA